MFGVSHLSAKLEQDMELYRYSARIPGFLLGSRVPGPEGLETLLVHKLTTGGGRPWTRCTRPVNRRK